MKKQKQAGWYYRIMEYPEGECGIHEVYVYASGKVRSYTEDPLIVGEDLEELLDILEIIKKDIQKRKPLKYKYKK